MRKSKFSESQIVEILKDAESGVSVADLLRKHGVSKGTFFKWRSKYGWSLGVGRETSVCVGAFEATLHSFHTILNGTCSRTP